jgi:hypothetical protein
LRKEWLFGEKNSLKRGIVVLWVMNIGLNNSLVKEPD